MHTGHRETTITTPTDSYVCLAVEYLNLNIADYLLQLSNEWVLFDPYGNFWTQDSEKNSDNVYLLGSNLELLRRDHDWLNTSVLLDGKNIDTQLLFSLRKPDETFGPDWALRFDFFLMNHASLIRASEIVVFPSLWHPDSSKGNLVMLTSSISNIGPGIGNSLITPIHPAAVLRAWPKVMIEYMTHGIGLTGQKIIFNT